ncbi:MAG: ABC transporter substrate-binding protein [Gammaproteobacteria bacterium]
MKKRSWIAATAYGLLAMTILFLSPAVSAVEEKILNVYNWADAISEPLLRKFEKETGIKINYSTYGSNEVLYAKLKLNPKVGYDVIVPSTYFIDRMRKQGMLQKIDPSKLPHLKNIYPDLMNKPYDPNNQYSIPYFWNITGIVLNTKYHKPHSVSSWADFWNPEYKNQLLILDDTREVLSIALLRLGYSINTTDPKHLKEAFELLKSLLPNIKLFNVAAQKSNYIDEDISLGMGWNGDAYIAKKENKNLRFIFPKEGFIISLDSMVIPKYAQHVGNAHKFIDFMLRPENAKELSLATGMGIANQAGVALLPDTLRKSQIVYPNEEILKRGQFMMDVGDAAPLYEKYFELLKLEG